MQIAFVGCGFVADFYVATLTNYPHLQLVGVVDRDPERAERFSRHYEVRAYSGLAELLADPRVEIVVNLTNPGSHYEVTKAALRAGKHVYSEKPLAMSLDQARELAETANRADLQLVSAPCSLLGETAQTIWKALRGQRIGRVRLVFAEMDDGMVHRMPYRKWLSRSGTPWPFRDEFETGCTLEHAGYYVTWLAAFFGPARSVTSFASVQIPDKIAGEEISPRAADFSVACIQFESGVVARLTCSIVAPHDHGLRIIGDDGVLHTRECWDYQSPVYYQQLVSWRRSTFLSPLRQRIRPVPGPRTRLRKTGVQRMDFARGIAELASSLRENRRCRLPADFCLHVNEIALAIHHRLEGESHHEMVTTFEPFEPMPWAR